MTIPLVEKLQNHVVIWFNEKIEKSKSEKLDKQRKEEFLEEINRARRDLQSAQNNYNYANGGTLWTAKN